jgi:hypothetical protein
MCDPIEVFFMDNLWTAEYSISQGAYHVDTLIRTLQVNIRNAALNRPNDYQVIFIGTAKECADACDKMRAFKDGKILAEQSKGAKQ